MSAREALLERLRTWRARHAGVVQVADVRAGPHILAEWRVTSVWLDGHGRVTARRPVSLTPYEGNDVRSTVEPYRAALEAWLAGFPTADARRREQLMTRGRR